jgi:hypothetical protein
MLLVALGKVELTPPLAGHQLERCFAASLQRDAPRTPLSGLLPTPKMSAEPAKRKHDRSDDSDDRAIAQLTDAQQDPDCQRQRTDNLKDPPDLPVTLFLHRRRVAGSLLLHNP